MGFPYALTGMRLSVAVSRGVLIVREIAAPWPDPCQANLHSARSFRVTELFAGIVFIAVKFGSIARRRPVRPVLTQLAVDVLAMAPWRRGKPIEPDLSLGPGHCLRLDQVVENQCERTCRSVRETGGSRTDCQAIAASS